MSATTQNESGFHSFNTKTNSHRPFSPVGIIIILLAILLGVFSGFFLATRTTHQIIGTTTNNTSSIAGGLKVGDVIGSNDATTFKDTTEGVMTAGGIDDEGQYHLVRPGGDSQNVYLTSSSVDLSQFLKHKVKVWGATQKAQKAGWLMDVGRVEVLQ